LRFVTIVFGENCSSTKACRKRLAGSVTVPPNQKVGPVASTLNEPLLGRTTVHVSSLPDPGRVESGSNSGSS